MKMVGGPEIGLIGTTRDDVPRLLALSGRFSRKRLLVIDLSGAFKDVYGEAIVVVRGFRERLLQCLLDCFHGRHEPGVRHDWIPRY